MLCSFLVLSMPSSGQKLHHLECGDPHRSFFGISFESMHALTVFFFFPMPISGQSASSEMWQPQHGFFSLGLQTDTLTVFFFPCLPSGQAYHLKCGNVAAVLDPIHLRWKTEAITGPLQSCFGFDEFKKLCIEGRTTEATLQSQACRAVYAHTR
jgi:hypothetical protein